MNRKINQMNARSYRTNLNLSPLDFPKITALAETSISYRSEAPTIVNKKVILLITKAFILTDMSTNKTYEVLKAQSVYEVPVNKIKTRQDVYEFYKDAILGLNEAYQYVQTQLPTLPSRYFLNQPIENYKNEIDRVFNLLNSRN